MNTVHSQMLQCRRWFNSETQKQLWEQRLEMGWPEHHSPFSVLVAAMGNYWQPGCREAVEAMCQHAWDAGHEVTLAEEHDRCYNPYDGLGSMRNMAYMRAIREGYEYICYVDNDVRPPADALARLQRRLVPVVSPIIRYADGQDHGMDLAKMESGKGLALVTSCVLSMVLFQTQVFLPWALAPFWDNAIGSDESLHFQRLAMAGHRPFVDTDVVVMATKPPTFPLKDRLDARTWVTLNGRE